MLYVKNLTIMLEKDLRTLIKDFNVFIDRFSKVAFIGEEGNGKSTVLKFMASKKLDNGIRIVSGKLVDKDEVVCYLPQQLSNRYLSMTPGEYIEYNFDLNYIDYTNLYSLLEELSLNKELIFDYEITIGNLSGGERLKFLLLCELLKNPTVLLLDEPNNDLDMDSLIWLENFIIKSKLTIVFVSHDKRILERCSNVIVDFEQVMKKKESRITVFKGDYRTYVDYKANKFENQTKQHNKEQELYDKKYKRYNEIYTKVHHLQNQAVRDPLVAKNLKDKMRSLKSQEKRLHKEKGAITKRPDYEDSILIKLASNNIYDSKKVLNFKLDKLEINGKLLVEDCSINIIGPQKIAIIGNNGVGKTSLLNEILNYMIKNKMDFSYMPQDYNEKLDKNITVVDYLKRNIVEYNRDMIDIMLGSLNFTREEMMHPVSKLSEGQRAKVFLAEIMIEKKDIIILDEPTRNLSIKSKDELFRVLKMFAGVVIFVSHDREFVDNLATTIYKIENKKLLKIKSIEK
ncbi:ABC-F family ATP-binding cassette domain-containing protein [Gemella sp. GH3]|uniref:ATP-binding cassette domain-containing protein n=1 Tax=unclassified Gemella TaxID=2624949 RepID=UPI0015CF976E|nr:MULTISPECIES: ATP-binding cassette domain-containing protein [unclassified Gemella]MBF0714223.1 ABC-F family ATP-binding cassette domain-containing protein [Gemella sp. GH3.1]NYS51175.1 ABC-F family ATP-binding cassette domain-containing protein [Gemella sp. GH3]